METIPGNRWAIPCLSRAFALGKDSDVPKKQIAAKQTHAPKQRKPCISIGENNQVRIADTDCHDALGSDDERFVSGLVNQIVNASSKGLELDKAASGFALAVLEGIKPRDEVEAMLAAQMAAIHMATMSFARNLNHIKTIPQQDSAEKTLNKLARTFTMQMEALKKYRSSGEQRITVQHVTVNDGGQAVVGTINHGGKTEGMEGGGKDEN